MEARSPLLGIDYGDVRIGLAISDDLRMLAHPLETVPGADWSAATARIAAVASERKVETIVIGLPLRMDGTEGAAVKRVREFSRLLQPRLPDSVSLVEIDERLSTVSAMEKMSAAGRTARNSRSQIDQAAAVEILQGYLDSLTGGFLSGEDDNEDEWVGESGDG
jgi:putative Holliday junction resolvase